KHRHTSGRRRASTSAAHSLGTEFPFPTMTPVAAPEEPVVITAAAPVAAPSAPRESHVVERAAIDASARGPVLTFFATGIAWLMIATGLGFITSIKLHSPRFLAYLAW